MIVTELASSDALLSYILLFTLTALFLKLAPLKTIWHDLWLILFNKAVVPEERRNAQLHRALVAFSRYEEFAGA